MLRSYGTYREGPPSWTFLGRQMAFLFGLEGLTNLANVEFLTVLRILKLDKRGSVEIEIRRTK